MYIPKRLIITASPKDSKYTAEVIQRVKTLNPSVIIESVNSNNHNPPLYRDSRKQLKYLKETLFLRERSGPFITTFASPGDIVEEMCSIVSLGWHCCSNCEYCYLQASTRNNDWHLLYTNIEKLDQELEVEPFIHRILLTILTAKSFIDQQSLMKIPAGFHVLANGIRGQLQSRKSNRITDNNLAYLYLADNIVRFLNDLNLLSTYCLLKVFCKEAAKIAKSSNCEELHQLVLSIRKAKHETDYSSVKSTFNVIINNTPAQIPSRSIKKLHDLISLRPNDYSEKQFAYIKRNLKDYYQKNSCYKPKLNISEYSDAVSIQHISKNLGPVMKILQKHPGIEMVLPTKSTNLDELLEYDGMGRMIVTMNFNTEYFIQTFEHGTASLIDRIAAAQKIQTAKGFRLNVAIEPMFFYRDYMADYKKLVKQIMQSLDHNKVETVILGTARFGQVLKRILVDIHPKTEVFDANEPLLPIKGDDSKWRYDDNQREQAYKEMISEFKKYSKCQYFLGAETPEMWENVGLNPLQHLSKFMFQNHGQLQQNKMGQINMKKFTKAKGGTKIEWAEKSWNPSVGCFKISKGCNNCYAEKMHKRHLGNPKQPKYIKPFNEVVTWESDLGTPLKWKKPQVVFVCSMSDLFHKDVPTDFIKSVFHVMNTSHHQYRILTKRSTRLKQLASELKWTPNIWAGVTVESAKYKTRIDDLRSVPAQARYISFEPLIDDLGNVDLSNIDWVIVGGESGTAIKELRPTKYEWVTNIRDKCLAENIPFFFKQWGRKEFNPDQNDPTIPKTGDSTDDHSPKGGHLIDGKEYSEVPDFIEYWGFELVPGIKAEIDTLDESVQKEKRAFSQSWINMGRILTMIKQKIDDCGDGRKYWQTYLGVESFQDYCQKRLQFSRETATQMRQSFQIIQDLRPKLLEGKVNDIPSYTKIRALHPHLSEIKADPVKFAPVIDAAFDSSKYRSEITKAVKEAFPGDTGTVTTEIDWNNYLNGVQKKIGKAVESDKTERLAELIGELRQLVK